MTEARLAVTAANVPADKWEEYNDFASQVRGSTEARLRLHMPGESAAAPETPVSESVPAGATGVENVEAHRLVVDAAERLHAGDRSGAQAKVDQAEKLNPNEPGLWALKGFLAAAGQNFAEAETDLRKEIAADPTNQAALAALGGVLSWEKKRPEAISTYQQLLKVKGGSDPAVVLPLSALLNAEKRYSESLPLLQTAALKHAGNRQLELQLGMTQLDAGREAEAVATLETALDGADDPGVLNDAAYQLSLHSKDDLPLAEKSARKAVELMDAADAKADLNALTPADLARTSLLAATWDTLGWILYQEGNAAGAESWIAAAWATTQQSEVGYHLGKVLEEEGKTREATEAYRHALEARSSGQTFSEEKDLEARAAALGAGGKLAGSELSQERSYKVSLKLKKDVSGDFFVKVSDTGLNASVRAASEAPELRGMESRLNEELAGLMQSPNSDRLQPKGAKAPVVRGAVLFCSQMLGSCTWTWKLAQDTRLDPTAADGGKTLIVKGLPVKAETAGATP